MSSLSWREVLIETHWVTQHESNAVALGSRNNPFASSTVTAMGFSKKMSFVLQQLGWRMLGADGLATKLARRQLRGS
jgi:hypothetical protein